ncbi:MAG: sugar transferase [Bellilinea sp.]
MPGRHSKLSRVPLSKRIFDLLISSLGLILTSPLLAVLAVLVWINHGRPILFRQPRPGHNGKIFTLYKFRSMSNELDSSGNPLPDTQRITRLGHFLRASSLDELPELINVLRGEMSLVGPRPLLVEYLPRYSAEQRRRHDVLPGITGWAQVNGRNALTWEEKFALDVWYVDHWSFGLDIKILWQTVGQVLQRRNITPPGQNTMEEFRG